MTNFTTPSKIVEYLSLTSFKHQITSSENYRPYQSLISLTTFYPMSVSNDADKSWGDNSANSHLSMASKWSEKDVQWRLSLSNTISCRQTDTPATGCHHAERLWVKRNCWLLTILISKLDKNGLEPSCFVVIQLSFQYTVFKSSTNEGFLWFCCRM